MVNDVQLFLPVVDVLNQKVKELFVRVAHCEERLEGFVGKMSELRGDILNSLQVKGGQSQVESSPRFQTPTAHPANLQDSSKWKRDLREKARATVLSNSSNLDLPLQDVMASALVQAAPESQREVKASASSPEMFKATGSTRHLPDPGGTRIEVASELPDVPKPETAFGTAENSLDSVQDIERQIDEVMKNLSILRSSVVGGASQESSLRESEHRCDVSVRLMEELARSSSQHASPIPTEPDLDLATPVLSRSTTKSSSTLSDGSSVLGRESRKYQRVKISEDERSPIRCKSKSRSDLVLEESSSSRLNLVWIMINTVLSRTRQKKCSTWVLR